ncbi:fluoride efflux transporter CrcB [Candidatus Fukatsuia symbiotica]|uniref:Fluoride-specific ion channel FluC n=1 Tax=Candidatus Fukatsuia symbiotica TaxID=1878942 RepID=A0A2U8I433_9GAMM|nr:fluoride efflux transporter CrcB [Candidatus Fukatsuia symbiotica]AWK13883.1 fluoride ion transporter CrcB [Candidatus Fukatsuia symbiotica]MEA9445783.1 fluoride efflux transporter CrcB [Candidatus Fukatsuia symbiotica]
MWKPIVSIILGSALGGLLRWDLGLKLNSLFQTVSLGTLVANLIAGYVVGVAVAYFSQAQGIAPEWRLPIVTGFCGGLSTFSMFSVEVVVLIQQGRVAWAVGVIAIHIIGSLLMTLLGMVSWQALATVLQKV